LVLNFISLMFDCVGVGCGHVNVDCYHGAINFHCFGSITSK
jgi:hypothetical protein